MAPLSGLVDLSLRNMVAVVEPRPTFLYLLLPSDLPYAGITRVH